MLHKELHNQRIRLIGISVIAAVNVADNRGVDFGVIELALGCPVLPLVVALIELLDCFDGSFLKLKSNDIIFFTGEMKDGCRRVVSRTTKRSRAGSRGGEGGIACFDAVASLRIWRRFGARIVCS